MTIKVRDLESKFQRLSDRATQENLENLAKMEAYEKQLAEKDEKIEKTENLMKAKVADFQVEIAL